MFRKSLVSVGVMAFLLVAAPAWACGGLVAPNGTINLVRTTTLAAYHNGVEHYVTGFNFVGAGGKFGSIVPLPDVPTKVVRAGDWTLQRLVLEVQPPVAEGRALLAFDSVAAQMPEVLLETTVDSLDITVLKGGATEVGNWARENGFSLSPDAPEVLDFYARRSPIFMAAKFNAKRAARQGIDQGTSIPVHLTIPTDNPWVPLRILALGRKPAEAVEADVFLLTNDRPALLAGASHFDALETGRPGLVLTQSAPASDGLMADLRSDKGMGWMPKEMYLTYLKLDTLADDLTYDLAIDVTGQGAPSPVDAGLTFPTLGSPERTWVMWVAGAVMVAAGAAALSRRRTRLA
ncbi:MAG TPA: DUF2330 domain-containing protein [Actinomycetota bacterium]|jgi:hypothetical protein|nr:DUF2330 domain-containing protein [Actinomycetota bacterium]